MMKNISDRGYLAAGCYLEFRTREEQAFTEKNLQNPAKGCAKKSDKDNLHKSVFSVTNHIIIASMGAFISAL